MWSLAQNSYPGLKRRKENDATALWTGYRRPRRSACGQTSANRNGLLKSTESVALRLFRKCRANAGTAQDLSLLLGLLAATVGKPEDWN